LFSDERNKREIEEDVEVAHVLVVFLMNYFWIGLSLPCCCCHETSVPVQEIISGFSIVNKVSDFTSFNFNLGALGEIDQKGSGAEELVFALGKEPVDVVGVSTSIGFIAGDERGGGVRLGHGWGYELHCDQNQFGFCRRY
jgi:hypothetical protein